jgi:S-adenosylmethionine:tRNA ribosyltransferase-isomerase
MIRMSDYAYQLNEESIARYPPNPRGSSKLLRVDGRGQVSYFDNFSRVFSQLTSGAHIVFNDSRVLDARLFISRHGTKEEEEERMELMLLDLGSVDVSAPCHKTTLRAMIRTETLNQSDVFTVLVDESELDDKVEIVAVHGYVVARVAKCITVTVVISQNSYYYVLPIDYSVWQEDEKSDGNGMECSVRIMSDASLDDYLSKFGSVPIPPYFQRESEASDKEAYNNVYAASNGSVAAPTAGLHFTSQLLLDVGSENCSYLTLHVGAGTFKPVWKENASDHDMHAESFCVSVEELKRIVAVLNENKPLIVVGSTSCRTLESLYWCGVKLIQHAGDKNYLDLELAQFEWKSLLLLLQQQQQGGGTISNVQALQALVEHAGEGGYIRGRTCLMITPETYEFRIVNHLVTNFHAPDSTLMLLVAAFVGGAKIRGVYEQAQNRGYRFLSYGDVCLFSRPGCNLPVDNEN